MENPVIDKKHSILNLSLHKIHTNIKIHKRVTD